MVGAADRAVLAILPSGAAGWKQRYEQTGYTVVVPAWPGVSDDVAGLRMDSSRLNGLRIQIPAPGKPLWQAALHLTTNSGDSRIDYGRAGRAPLLFIAGTADHIVPPKVNHKNAKAYKVGVVADYALGWAESH
ncbi:MAG: hypothetical protein JWP56_192 [Aeromicrobium sp.]|nr:hypothetical protein [Aeromicrobium sp.]